MTHSSCADWSVCGDSGFGNATIPHSTATSSSKVACHAAVGDGPFISADTNRPENSRRVVPSGKVRSAVSLDPRSVSSFARQLDAATVTTACPMPLWRNVNSADVYSDNGACCAMSRDQTLKSINVTTPCSSGESASQPRHPRRACPPPGQCAHRWGSAHSWAEQSAHTRPR